MGIFFIFFFFSVKNWIRLKHAVLFCLKNKNLALSNRQVFYLHIFYSSPVRIENPWFKASQYNLFYNKNFIRAVLVHSRHRNTQLLSQDVCHRINHYMVKDVWQKIIKNLPQFPRSNLSTGLIVISYFVLERKSLSEILLAAGAHVILSMHSSPLSYSTKRLANLFSCIR